jgi:hypothetical protein
MSSVQVKAIQNLTKNIPGVTSPVQKRKYKTFAQINKENKSKPVKTTSKKTTTFEKPKKTSTTKLPNQSKNTAKSKQFTEVAYTPKTPPVDLRGFENK